MESIRSQGQGVGEEADDELEEEEGDINDDHDLDAGRLGPRHLEAGHDGRGVAAATDARLLVIYYKCGVAFSDVESVIGRRRRR